MSRSGSGIRVWWLAVPLLAVLLFLGGCGGVFYGEMGDWEPGQVGALPGPGRSNARAASLGGIRSRGGVYWSHA
jgi:hypothetical protein